MPVPGEVVNFMIGRQTPAGAGASGKVAADFIMAPSLDGTVTTPVTTVTEIGLVGNIPNQFSQYKVAVTLGATAGRFNERIMPASGYDLISPDIFQGEIEAYDLDSLAALMLTQQGQPAVQSASPSNLGDIIDGDSYQSPTLTVPLGMLTAFGQSDLTGLTIEAALMSAPGGTSYPITATVVSVPGLTFNIGWNTQQHPALTTQNSVNWTCDLQFIKTGPPKIIVTTNRYTFNQVWQADTRTT
jgi:hypothetical protein